MASKRRKIVKKKKDNLSLFREDVLMLVQGKDISTTFGYYCNTFLLANRTKVKKVEKERFSGCDWTKNSSLWGDGIDQKQYVTDWNAMDGSKRLEELKSYGSEEEFILNSLLKKTKVTSLRNVLNLHFSDSSVDFDKLSKHHLIQEIKNRFYQRTGDIEKRETEEENLTFFDEEQEASQEYHFLYLCNQQIPVDVLRHILTFIHYDSNMLFKIGRISKVFYITILCSWPHVTIRKTNVFKISLLVLRSVRAVTFEVPSSSPGKTFNTKELEYVLKHLNPKRLRTVTIKSMVYTFCRCVKLFCGKVRPVFQNVQTLRFDTSDWLSRNSYTSEKFARKKDYDVYRSLSKFRLSKSFPQLQKVDVPLIFSMLSGLSHLQDLSINLNIPIRFDNASRLPAKISLQLGMISSNKRDIGIPKEQIRKLTIDIHRFDRVRLPVLAKFINSGFNSLEYLKIVTSRTFDNSIFFPKYQREAELMKSFHLNFSQCFSKLESLEELILYEMWSYTEIPLLEFSGSLSSSPSFEKLKRLRLATLEKDRKSGYHVLPLLCVRWRQSIVDLINSMTLRNLEVLEIAMEYDEKNDRLNTLLLEKMNQKLFQYRNVRIGIRFQFEVERSYAMSSWKSLEEVKFFLESTNPSKSEPKRNVKKRCSIDVFSRDSYSTFTSDRKLYEELRRKKVTEVALLHQLMTDLPTILGKEENRREVTFKDISAHTFCVYRYEWRNEKKISKGLLKTKDGNGSKEQKKMKKKYVEESERVISGKSCLQFFKDGMMEEDFECESKELSYSRSKGCKEVILFT